MSLAERMQNNDFVVCGQPYRCSLCDKPHIFGVQKINDDFFVGPLCNCEPHLKKKYDSMEDATNALFTRDYKK